MDHRRNIHTMQIPPYHHYLPNDDVSFHPYGTQNISFDHLYPPIDPINADQSLSNMFSLLNMSPETHSHSPPFLPENISGQIGCSVNAGEGLVSPARLFSRQQWCDDVESLRRDYLLGFDFDRKWKSNFDDYEQMNLYCRKVKNQNESKDYNNKFMNSWSLKKLRGRIYTMAKDQNGCKILQALFETPTFEEVEFVLSEVVCFISDLMKDQFGNYLVQKLVVVCNDDQKMQLLLSLIKDIILVCMNPHGTRAVQKLLENLQDPNQVKFVMKALHHGATTLATDPNGHHVVQYCLVNFHTDINMPILTEIANKCYKIATDRSGCCVLQACVEHARGEVRTRIISEIMANSVHLAQDPFGNYVLQHMVGLNIPELTVLLVRQLQGNFASLSCNKYGSNVVEKCLNESGEEISTLIVLELMRSPNSSLLLVDPYANFVIQSALKVSKGFARDCLCALISKNMLCMQTNLYGKKILGRFNKKKITFA